MLLEYKPIEVVEAPIGSLLEDRVDYLNREHRENEAIDVAIELHLNGFEDSSATGTKCLYYPGSIEGLL